MWGKFLLLTFFFLIIPLNGQVTYQGPANGSVNSGIVLNTDNFSDSSNSLVRTRLFNIYEYESSPELINWNDSTNVKSIYYDLLTREDNTLDSTILFKNFQGISQTTCIPPDDYIAVGPDYLMMVVNNLFRIYDKTGSIIKTINADIWYNNLLPSGSGVFDPKIVYDQISSRWVMVWLTDGGVAGTCFYLISVSDDADPNGTWFNWALPSDVNGSTPSGNWADYEGVGFDENAIYLTSNQFSFSGFYDYVKLRIIDKTNIYVNSNPGTVNWDDIWSISIPGNSNSAYGIRPTQMYSGSDKYYLGYIPSNGGNYFSVYELTNPIGNPALTGFNLQISNFANAPDASQLGGGLKIETGGTTSKYELVFRDGLIYFVHPIRNPIYSSLSSMHFISVNTATHLIDKEIIMGDDEHFFFYPAMAVDKYNNLIFSYSRSSVNEFAGGYYTILPDSSVPTGSYSLKSGNAYYYQDFGSGRNRWGDYSGAWIDPSDSLGFWICSEYVPSLNTWGTWIGEVLYDSEVPVELISFSAQAKGNSAELNWVAATETNNYGYQINRKSSDRWENVGFINGKGTTTERQSYSLIDKDLSSGNYRYRLVQIDLNGTENILGETSVNINTVIGNYSLLQNYPNPFNPSTHIMYEIPTGSNIVHVKLSVCDILGNEVTELVNENKSAGKYDIIFNSNGLSSGVYIYKILAGKFSAVKKMILIR